MKNFKATMIALVLGSAVLSLTGCEKNEGSAYGKAVLFHCASGSNGTKAAYSGVVTSNVERIDWEENDLIRIYCAEASEPTPNKYADYRVKSGSVTTSGSISNATIEKNGTDELCWGTNEPHNFYAVYPSPATSGSWVSDISGKTVTGTVKAAQNGDGRFSDGMVLVAKNTVTDPTAFDKDAVFLEFEPITTAIKFSVKNGMEAPLTLKKVELVSESHALSGDYYYDIDLKTSTDKEGGIKDEERKVYFSSTAALDKDDVDPYVFTFFLRPGDNFDDLSIVITDNHDVTYTSKLKTAGGYYTFNKGSKTVITGIVIEKVLNLLNFASLGAGADIRTNGTVSEEILF